MNTDVPNRRGHRLSVVWIVLLAIGLGLSPWPLRPASAQIKVQFQAQGRVQIVQRADATRAAPADNAAGASTDDRENPTLLDDVAVLRERGIEPTFDGLEQYFQSVYRDHTEDGRVAKLIEQLGDERFTVRERAQQRLSVMPDLTTAALREAARSDDAEVRRRAEQIIEARKLLPGQYIMPTALRVITHREIQGLVPILLKVVALFNDVPLTGALGQAIVTTTRPQDAPPLRQAAKSNNPRVRGAAMMGLARAVGAEARQDLATALNDPAELVRFAAARGLADLGDRRCLPVLVDLLDTEQPRTRSEALAILRALTGQVFGLSRYDQGPAREKKIGKWRRWVKQSGPTAKLRFPVDLALAGNIFGRTLLAGFNANTVHEFDIKGNKVWEVKVNQPYGLAGLIDGHRLIGSYGDKHVTRYDAVGKVIWRSPELPGGAMGIDTRPDGKVIVACSDAQMLVELDEAGEIISTIGLKGRPVGVQYLPNRRLLVVCQRTRRIVEIDMNGNVKWSIDDLNDPQTAQRLPNGNTLICEAGTGHVSEIDPSGKTVWKSPQFKTPVDAQRLPNGDTLIVVQQDGLVRVTPEGEQFNFADIDQVHARGRRY